MMAPKYQFEGDLRSRLNVDPGCPSLIIMRCILDWWVFAKQIYWRHDLVVLFLTWVLGQELLATSTAAPRQMTVWKFTDLEVPLDHQDYLQIGRLQNIRIYLMQIRDPGSGLKFSLHWSLEPHVSIAKTMWPEINNAYIRNRRLDVCRCWYLLMVLPHTKNIKKISSKRLLWYNSKLICMLAHLTWPVVTWGWILPIIL